MDAERIIRAARDVEKEYRMDSLMSSDRIEREIAWAVAESFKKFAERAESGKFPYLED